MLFLILKFYVIMKAIKTSIFSIALIVTLLLFQHCKKDNGESDQDVTINKLKSKEWVVNSVNVPASTATLSSDWDNFKMSFTATQITTSGHPALARAVWPSGSCTVSEDGKSITRHDGVVMHLNSVTETGFTVTFAVPPGTDTGGRIAALDGEYTFNMK